MFKSEEFDLKSASLAAEALAKILARRTHVKVVFGEERRVAGTLGLALNLPAIRKRLESRSTKQRQQSLDEFKALWDTLSSRTRTSVLEAVGWYDPNKLAWDDQRSNRRPDLSEDS